MTAPTPTTEAALLREALARTLNETFKGYLLIGGRWSHGCEMAAGALLAGPLAPLLADRDRLSAALATARAEGEALRQALRDTKTWIDTDLPAGTLGAGLVYMAITRAIEAAPPLAQPEQEGQTHGR